MVTRSTTAHGGVGWGVHCIWLKPPCATEFGGRHFGNRLVHHRCRVSTTIAPVPLARADCSPAPSSPGTGGPSASNTTSNLSPSTKCPSPPEMATQVCLRALGGPQTPESSAPTVVHLLVPPNQSMRPTLDIETRLFGTGPLVNAPPAAGPCFTAPSKGSWRTYSPRQNGPLAAP